MYRSCHLVKPFSFEIRKFHFALLSKNVSPCADDRLPLPRKELVFARRPLHGLPVRWFGPLDEEHRRRWSLAVPNQDMEVIVIDDDDNNAGKGEPDLLLLVVLCFLSSRLPGP